MDKSTKNEKRLDKIITSLVLLLLAGVMYVTTVYNISDAVKSIVWLLCSVVAIVGMYFTSLGRKVLIFANESKIELLKVVWPTKQETIQTTSIVMLMVTITGFLLWAADSLIMYMIAKITHIG